MYIDKENHTNTENLGDLPEILELKNQSGNLFVSFKNYETSITSSITFDGLKLINNDIQMKQCNVVIHAENETKIQIKFTNNKRIISIYFESLNFDLDIQFNCHYIEFKKTIYCSDANNTKITHMIRKQYCHICFNFFNDDFFEDIFSNTGSYQTIFDPPTI